MPSAKRPDRPRRMTVGRRSAAGPADGPSAAVAAVAWRLTPCSCGFSSFAATHPTPAGPTTGTVHIAACRKVVAYRTAFATLGCS